MKKNHLEQETSPYLLQHVDNPVNWYPWGKEAHLEALKEKKPILLSIGYSACHWCHVMAHESFEDSETANLMNQLYVNIKVDKEERPDLDKVYQISHQLFTGRAGGWPLTVFLTPEDHLPFFIGTYFPKESKYQLPAFKDLLKYISAFYHEHKNEVIALTQEFSTNFRKILTHTPACSDKFNLQPWEDAIKQIISDYDHENGGFGTLPKFPHPNLLDLLLYDAATPQFFNHDHLSIKMVKHTLNKMVQKGIFDQIGGGFFRYCTDAKWENPHFEKMLYDNAELLSTYATAHIFSPQPFFSKALELTMAWLIIDMRSPEGGFFTSVDADSEGKEGYYYLWDKAQIKKLLNPEEFVLIELYFNLQQPPNFENLWHLHVTHFAENIAQFTGIPKDKVQQLISVAEVKLLKIRNKRIHPFIDTKILTGWNALAIKGLILGGMAVNNPLAITAAEHTLSFIQQKLWQDNCLFASYKDGSARFPAYIDDYAFLLDAVLTLLQYRWNNQDLMFALALAENLLNHFYDHAEGGFFYNANTHEPLIYRPKILTDEATPAGNSIACFALQRLGYLLGDSRYLEAVKKTLQLVWSDLLQFPKAYSSLLIVLKEYIEPPLQIIIRGDLKISKSWQEVCLKHYSPKRMVFIIDAKQSGLPSVLSEKISSGPPVAYICQGTKCLAPIDNLEELKEKIFQ